MKPSSGTVNPLTEFSCILQISDPVVDEVRPSWAGHGDLCRPVAWPAQVPPPEILVSRAHIQISGLYTVRSCMDGPQDSPGHVSILLLKCVLSMTITIKNNIRGPGIVKQIQFLNLAAAKCHNINKPTHTEKFWGGARQPLEMRSTGTTSRTKGSSADLSRNHWPKVLRPQQKGGAARRGKFKKIAFAAAERRLHPRQN